MSNHSVMIVIMSLVVVICSPLVVAGGLYLNEFGTPVMGNAGAGSSAEASDASTAFHNPAGMTRLGQRQFMLSMGLGYSDVSFDKERSSIIGGNGGNAGGWIPMAGTFYAQPIRDDLWFGFSTFTLAGSALDYGTGWVGRYQCNEIALVSMTAMPTLALRVNDWLSIGAGPTIMYGKLDLEVGAPLPRFRDAEISIDGDDVAYGYSLSTMMELSERTRVGVVYFSETNFEFEGDLKTKGGPLGGLEFGSETDLDLAQMVRGSVYHRLDDTWAVVGSLGWEDWSTISDVFVSTDTRGASLPRNWRDTWHYAAGVHYKLDDKWLLRTGVAYDTSPVDASDRTADMPLDRQVRYAVGADYQWSESLTVGASFVYVDLGNAKINAPLYSGEYDRNDLYFLGVHANWKF